MSRTTASTWALLVAGTVALPDHAAAPDKLSGCPHVQPRAHK